MNLQQNQKTGENSIAIGISPKNREQVAEALKHQLADTHALQLKTKYYHWNVTGPNFHSLHLLFDAQYTQLAAAVDELAERIRALGVIAPGTSREFKQMTSLTEDEKLPASWQDMVANLVGAHETVIKQTRERVELAQQDNDEGTADLFIRRLQEHEKTAWFLRSHL